MRLRLAIWRVARQGFSLNVLKEPDGSGGPFLDDVPDHRAEKDADAIRAAGKLRSEGKGYVMQEGDTVEFRFNV